MSSNGDLYIADGSLNDLGRLSSGTFRVIAGNGKVGFSGDGGPAVEAELDDPQGIVAGPNGTIDFADSGNNRVRSISPNGTITTVAGDGGNQSPRRSDRRQPRVQSARPTRWRSALTGHCSSLLRTQF